MKPNLQTISDKPAQGLNLKITVHSDILYKKMVENMNEAVWMGDKDERTIYANPKFCKMMESTLEELLGRESYEFWDRDSIKTVRRINIHERKKGISSSYEGVIVTKNGNKIPVLLNGTPLPDGGTIGIMTDLSEFKKKEQNEKMLSRAIQHASDTIIIFNDKGEITSWNKGAKTVFGYKKEEIIGLNIEKLFPEKQLQPFFKNKKISHLEIFGINKHKKSVKIAANLTPIYTDNKKIPAFFLLIARDITNQTKFEEELTLKYQKIQEAYNKFGIIKRQMDYIFEMLEIYNGFNDIKNLADFVVTSLIMLTRVDTCVLRIYNKEKDTLDLISNFGLQDWKGKARINYQNSLGQKAFEEKRPFKIIDIASETRYNSPYLAKKNNMSSLLLIPLQFKNNIAGTISLYVSPEKKLALFENEFIEKYAKLIELLIGTLLENKK